MRITPLLVARPTKARAVEVTSAAADVAVDVGTPAGAFRPAVVGPLQERKGALDRLLTEGVLVPDAAPEMFVYRVVCGGTRWIGLVCGADAHELIELATRADPGAMPDAHAELTQLGWQVEPAVVRCTMPDEIADQYVGDTNDRPAYHFVAGGATHSAWLVRDQSPYLQMMAHIVPTHVPRGARAVMAAHRAEVPVLAILTRDFPDDAQSQPSLAPRCGLFVLPANCP
jgi:hypothetical protein